MSTKNRFPATAKDIKQTSYEEMGGTEIAEPDNDKDIKQGVPTGAILVTPEQLQELINKGIDTKLKGFEETISSKTAPKEIHTRKVQSSDDLPEFENWEVKDRIYVLCTGFSSLSHGIKDRHKKNSPLMYKGRALRFSTSQASFFMDKQEGEAIVSYISIENGRKLVPKEDTHLQKFLAIHPDNGIVFKEFDAKAESKKAYDAQQLKVDALILSRQIDTATLVSVAMLMCRSFSETWDLYTVKHELHAEIEANPKLFIKLANDKSLKLKSTGRIAVFRGYLRYADYRFYDENDSILIEVNRNENEYDALAGYFASSEGRVLYEYLSQKIGS